MQPKLSETHLECSKRPASTRSAMIKQLQNRMLLELTVNPFQTYVRPGLAEFLASFIYVTFSLLSSAIPLSAAYFRPFFIGLGRTIILPLAVAFGSVRRVLSSLFIVLTYLYFYTVEDYHKCGAQVNPAVSFASFIGGSITISVFFLYFVLQIFGAFLAAIFFKSLTFESSYDLSTGGVANLASAPNFSTGQIILLEIFIHFAWSLFYLSSQVDSDGRNILSPVALGSFVFIAASVSNLIILNCPNNPAQAFGAALATSVYMEQGIWDSHYVWWIGPFVGAILAALIYRVLLVDPTRRLASKQ